MTALGGPGGPTGPGEPAGPEIVVAPVISCSAGVPTTIEVQIWHHGPRPAGITVAVRGLDAEWTPPPVLVGTLDPGQSVTVPLELRPGPSALGARYPFVVVAAAADPLGRGEPALTSAESTLVIGGREPTVLDLDPPQVTTVFGRRVRLTVTNPSLTDRALTVSSTVPAGLSADFPPGPVDVPAGRTVTLRGKVRVRRPRVFGTVQTHSYAVAARGQGAPVVVTGTVKARPVFRGALVRALVLLAVVGLWAGLAVVAIPRISSSVTSQNDAGAPTPTASSPPASSAPSAPAGSGQAGAGQGSGGSSGSGGSGGAAAGDQGSAGSSGGTGGGAAGSGGGSDAGQSAGSAAASPTGGAGTDQSTPASSPAPAGGETTGGGTTGGETTGATAGDQSGSADQSGTVALRGLVTGSDPGGVTVVLGPTSLNEAADQDAQPAPGTDDQTASGLRAAEDVIGKVPGSAVRVVTAQDPPTITTTTNDDGTFAIGGVRPQGFYLLTLARAGYQTQRFVVNGSTLTGADPMKVAMVAGGGALSGTVTGPNGPVGAATVTITDGHVSVQTSSVSPGAEGDPGSWSVTGLSTPGTYLVSVAGQGFGTASTLVTLGAGGTATADLTLQTGVAAVTGLVSGQDALGQLGGLGGISVSISGTSGDVTTSRTATTLTTGPVGRFTLPDLPTPGDYTLTVSGDGYLDQVQTVSLAAGVGSVDLNISMIRADGAVSGTVVGNPASGDQPAEGGLVGAGLTLTGPSGTTKTMSTSDPPGSFRFTGVTPGVYVLSGSMFGRVTSSVTVEVTASGEATADLTLLSSADTELPATGHIQGRVTDSRTGGDLTCDRAIDTSVKCLITASVSVPAIDPNTGRIDPDAPPVTISTQVGPSEPYVLPAADDKDHPGLVPGLYTVTITAPGYEPGSVSVQVPQGATTSAEPVSLVPLSLIGGRLTTRVGTPQGATCVAVVATGTTPPAQSAGCTPAADGVNCTVGNDPSVRCGLVQSDGTYQVRGLVHGGYTVVVIPTDTEYIAPEPFSLTIELGSDGRYDPVLDRLGRIAVTVLAAADNSTAALSPVANASVVATGSNGALPAVDSDDQGLALIKRLQGSYSITATDGTGDGAKTASITGVSAQLNQEVDVSMVVTRSFGPVIGRLVTNDGSTQPVGIADVQVTVSGVTGYNGTTPIMGSATLTTDSNGCFAIVPTLTTPVPTGATAACPAQVGDSAIGTMSVPGTALVARPVSVTVRETDLTQGPVTVAVAIKDDPSGVSYIPVTTLQPKPSTTDGLSLGTSPADANRGAATITVSNLPPGAGQVAVTEPSTAIGTFVWTDPLQSSSNLAAPGRYTMQASLAGYTPSRTTANVFCPLAKACYFYADPDDPAPQPDPAGFSMIRNPMFSGSVTVLPAGTDVSAATFTVTPSTSNISPVTLSFNGSGPDLQWQETGAPTNLVTPGTYTVSVSLAGFDTSKVTFTCGKPALGTETCTLPTLTLRQLSTPTFKLISSVTGTDSQPPTQATVTLSGQSIGTITSFTPNSPPIQTTLQPMSSTDTYTLKVTAPGFRAFDPSQAGSITCESSSGQTASDLTLFPGATTCTVTLTQLGRIAITSAQPITNGQTVLSSVAISATLATQQDDGTWVPDPGAQPWQATTGTDGKATLIGTAASEGLEPGSYLISAALNGYQPASSEQTVVTIDLSKSDSLNQSKTMLLIPSAVTLQVSLQDGSTAVLPTGTVTVSGWSQTGSQVSRTCTIPASDPINCTADEQAQGTVVDDGDIKFGAIPPGLSYTVSFEPSGVRYQRASLTTQVVVGVDLQSVTLPLARRASGQSGTIRNTDGTVVGDAQVSLRQANDPTTVVNDFDGNPLTTTTDANGRFTLKGVPDGLYRAMVDACGYDRVITDTLTFNSQATPNPSDLTIQVRRSVRDVTITLTSTAGADLSGATATVQPDPAGSGDPGCTGAAATPPNTAQSSLAVGAGNTVRIPQLPTGQWTVAVDVGGRAVFGAFTTESFGVTQQDRGTPTLPPNTVPASVPVAVALTVVQTQLTMTATLPVNDCNPLPANASLVLTRDPGGPDESIKTLAVPIDAGTGKATATVLLPPDGYSWTVSAGSFTPTTGSGSFTANDTTPAVALTLGFDAPLAVVTGTVTVSGSTRPDITITGTHAGDDPVHSDGTGTLCVPPDSGWTFSIKSDTIFVPDVTGVTITLAGPNAVQFTGFSLQPGVALESVPRRPADTANRSIAVGLGPDGGSTLWSGTITLVPPATSGRAADTLILPAGPYTLTAGASAPFGGDVVTGIDPSSTPTPTATLPYQAVTLAVTASIGGTRSPARITITPPTGGSSQSTTVTAPAIFADIDPDSYTISASYTDGTTTYTGKVTPPAFAAGDTPQIDVPMTAPPPPEPPAEPGDGAGDGG